MNIGRSDIDWKSLSHNEIDRIIAERIEADNKRIEANGGKKSKRAGYILERIAEINNLREADKEAQDGKVKKNRFIRRHNLHPGRRPPSFAVDDPDIGFSGTGL